MVAVTGEPENADVPATSRYPSGLPVGVVLAVSVVAATLLMVIADGTDGAEHGLLPEPVQLIYCGAQSVVPLTVTVAVSLATTDGVYCTYTGVAVNEVP